MFKIKCQEAANSNRCQILIFKHTVLKMEEIVQNQLGFFRLIRQSLQNNKYNEVNAYSPTDVALIV